jgi:hypothetical protein
MELKKIADLLTWQVKIFTDSLALWLAQAELQLKEFLCRIAGDLIGHADVTKCKDVCRIFHRAWEAWQQHRVLA